MDGIRHHSVVVDGVGLHVAEAGPEDGPLVVLLHGFPELWLCWQRQIGSLVEAGYRVLAPDQRGYGESEKPRSVSAYGASHLAADVVGLIRWAGRVRATLVGHDWGGIVAWWVAIRHPEYLDRLVVLNAPHPAVFGRYLLNHPSQVLRSAYALAFQLPRIPEWLLSRNGWGPLVRAMRRTSRPGTFGEADLEEYRRAWSQPGAMTAMLNWYRAALRHPPPRPAEPRVGVPTLLIWGTQDRFLSRGLAPAGLALCDRGRLEFIEEATHWVQHEEPARVNQLLLEFLRESRVPGPPEPTAGRGAVG